MGLGTQGPAGSTEPDPLPGLPRPPDQPKTLYQPAPSQKLRLSRSGTSYFEHDPVLDACCMPQPGWLWDVEMDILGTHVVNQVGNAVPPYNSVPTVPMAKLDWTFRLKNSRRANACRRGLGNSMSAIASC